MFRLLLSLLFLPAIADACGFSLVYNRSLPIGEATVEYSKKSNRLFRGPHYNGTQLPPWVPLKIHTVYHANATQLDQQTNGDLSNYVNKAIKRLGEMLMVRKTEKVEAKPCRGSPFDQNPIVTNDHNFILYIYAKAMDMDGVLAGCSHCDAEALMVNKSNRNVYHEYDAEYAKLKEKKKKAFLGRPVSGLMTINTKMFMKRENNEDKWISTMMHEISHALVFTPWHYAHYINCDEATGKCQLHPGQKRKFKPPSGRIEAPYEIPGIVKKVQRKWLLRSGEKDHDVHVMTLPTVRKAAAEYFNCPEIDGVELENQGGGGTSFAHLEMRVYAHDAMNGVIMEKNAFSAITLSFFEASGWYKVNYSYAEPMTFGKGKGCDFVMKSCGHYNAYPFCSDNSFTCNEDRTAIEQCNAFWYGDPIPPEYDYFQRPPAQSGDGFPLEFADFCPYYVTFNKINNTDSRCSSPADFYITSGSLQLFSKTARCFELKTLEKDGMGEPINVKIRRTVGNQTLTANFTITHGCYEHKCENGQLWIKPAGGEFHPCEDGQSISVNLPGPKAGMQIYFQIQCPDCNSLCGTKCAGGKVTTEKSTRADNRVATIAILALLFLCLYLCLSRKRASK